MKRLECIVAPWALALVVASGATGCGDDGEKLAADVVDTRADGATDVAPDAGDTGSPDDVAEVATADTDTTDTDDTTVVPDPGALIRVSVSAQVAYLLEELPVDMLSLIHI